MTPRMILVRDRVTGMIARVRGEEEPVKLRVCRSCGRVHSGPAVCLPAAA